MCRILLCGIRTDTQVCPYMVSGQTLKVCPYAIFPSSEGLGVGSLPLKGKIGRQNTEGAVGN